MYVAQIGDIGEEIPIQTDGWISQTTDTIHNLISNKEYVYRVKASSFTRYDAGDTTAYSNTVHVRTLPYPYEKQLRVVSVKNGNGSVNVFAPELEVENGEIHVFNTIGQRLRTVQIRGREIVTLTDLPKNVVLIIQSGKQRTKILLVD